MWWVFLGILLVATPAWARQLPAPSARPQASIAPAGESPEERLARARQSYLNNDFPSTISSARDLLYPEVKLRREEDVLTAHRLLALAYYLSHAEDSSEREFTALLALQPDFSLDPVLDPPQAMAFLERIKTREHQRLEEIERRRREEAEAAAREEERRRRDEEARRLHELEDRLRRELKPVVKHRNRRWMCLLPLGFGQFQNGETGKGAAFLTTQLALGVSSIALWGALEDKYQFGRLKVPTRPLPNGDPNPDRAAARAMQYSHLVLGGLFWVDVAWGIIDAFVKFKPEIVIGGAATSRGAVVMPYVPAGGGAGLSLQGAF